MFEFCSSLTVAPVLCSTTYLPNRCYLSMFEGCTKLKISDVEVASGIKILDIPAGTAYDEYWNHNMFLGTSGTFKGNPEIGKAYW